MRYSYDTAVVGAGPSGTACAITLQKRGRSVCLIDKKYFPRPKTCGGLITSKTAAELASLLSTDVESLSGLFTDSCSEVGLYNGGLLCRTSVGTPFRFVNRNTFDNELVKHYVRLGGKLIEGDGCADTDDRKNIIYLDSGNSIQYKHLVAADGANSRSRNRFGLELKKIGFCIETHIPKKAAGLTDEIRIYFDAAPNGYGWAFPSGESMCVGLGGVYDRSADYRGLLDAFLKKLGIQPSEYLYSGAFVPYGSVADQKKASDNVLFVGDAAGLVDPISGEGLYFAVGSGIKAAKAIIESKSPKTAYLSDIAWYIEQIKAADKLQSKLFGKAGLAVFSKLIKDRPELLRFYCERQIAEYGYPYKKIHRLAADYKSSK